MKRTLLEIGRAALVLASLLTSVLSLLAFIPFTYEQIYKGGLLPPVTAIIRLHPLLAHLQNDWASFSWSLFSLLPVALLGIVDCVRQHGHLNWSPYQSGEDHRLFTTAWRSAFLVAATYSAI